MSPGLKGAILCGQARKFFSARGCPDVSLGCREIQLHSFFSIKLFINMQRKMILTYSPPRVVCCYYYSNSCIGCRSQFLQYPHGTWNVGSLQWWEYVFFILEKSHFLPFL